MFVTSWQAAAQPGSRHQKSRRLLDLEEPVSKHRASLAPRRSPIPERSGGAGLGQPGLRGRRAQRARHRPFPRSSPWAWETAAAAWAAWTQDSGLVLAQSPWTQSPTRSTALQTQPFCCAPQSPAPERPGSRPTAGPCRLQVTVPEDPAQSGQRDSSLSSEWTERQFSEVRQSGHKMETPTTQTLPDAAGCVYRCNPTTTVLLLCRPVHPPSLPGAAAAPASSCCHSRAPCVGRSSLGVQCPQ